MNAILASEIDDWENDPIVREAVDQAVAPYVGIVSAEYLQAMRTALADHLLMHPTTELLIRSLRDRAPVQQSGEQPTGSAVAESPQDTTRKATGSGA